jgi:hypothetical protein
VTGRSPSPKAVRADGRRRTAELERFFVGCAVGRVTIEQVVREIWPFYAVMFAVLMLVTYIPAISLWLPRMPWL